MAKNTDGNQRKPWLVNRNPGEMLGFYDGYYIVSEIWRFELFAAERRSRAYNNGRFYSSSP